MACKGIIPSWSLFAAILECLGIAMFCSSTVLGVNEYLKLLESDSTSQKQVDDNVIYIIEIVMYSLTGATMVWAIGFLFHAFMVTAQTRMPEWDHSKISCSSNACVSLAVFLNSVAMVCWVAITGASVVAFTFSLMLMQYDMLTNDSDVTPPPTTTLDLRVYGLNQTVTVEDLAGISSNLVIFFSLSVGGAALITYGLVVSVACMASNWVLLRVGERWKDYAETRRGEEMELRQMNVHKSSEQLANNLYY